MSKVSTEVDLLIVGAGPAGLSAALEARRAGIEDIRLLEKEASRAFIAQDGPEAQTLCNLNDEVQRLGIPTHFGAEVVSIRRQRNGWFEVSSQAGATWTAQTLVIAIGVKGRPRLPDFPLPTSLEGHLHFDPTGPLPEGESVLVVGSGDAAADSAAYLSERHPLTLAEPTRDQPPATLRPLMENRVRKGRITHWRDADLSALHDTGSQPRIVAEFRDGRRLEVQHVLFALGGSTHLGFLSQAGICIEGWSRITDPAGETCQPGLFLAGDLISEGRGSLQEAIQTGRRLVRDGLCQGYFACKWEG